MDTPTFGQTGWIAQLPSSAAFDQSNVPEGYYRTRAGRIAKIHHNMKVRRYRVKNDPDNYAPVGDNTKLVPTGEEMIIKCDVYADEAMCRVCNGTGHSDATCTDCAGTRKWYVTADGVRDKRAGADRSQLREIDCESCKASSYSSPIPRSTGCQPCRACRATGQAIGERGIAFSTAFEDEPTTGVILAIGPEVTRFNRGDRVMYSRFAGQEYTYDGRKYRIMRQNYPMAKVIGNAEVRIREAAGGMGQR